ncbi:hypothetical protein CEP54_000122 [Fusarium duplospermum]|uniref:Uncharacterized protein n=1 Tax=Fusarium duplospermum TaxID=1325734 RepID=A0A428R8U2_9HYPO|nr:hypothetical protein CEP54_000122 [Fusarium duplospermum]
MKNTTLEAHDEVQDLQVFEYIGWYTFWIFFCLIFLNFFFMLSHTDFLQDHEDPVHNTNTRRRTAAGMSQRNNATSANSSFYNFISSPATKTGFCDLCQCYKWVPDTMVFRNITSRNIQRNVVITSSLILLAQIIEGFWIMEMLTRYMSQGVDPVAIKTATAKSFAFISLILHVILCLGKVFIWLMFLALGITVVTLQYDFIKEVLKIKIEEDQSGCQCDTRRNERVNRDRWIDLERGTNSRLEVIYESEEE